MQQEHIVILGGGYGGLRAVEHLAGDPRFRITLIDRHPYHYLQTEAYGYIAGRFDIHDITIDLANWCRGFGRHVAFKQAEITGVDPEAKEVVLEHERIPYDSLIVATGARTNFFAFIKGLRENSYGVKNLQRAFAFRQTFEQLVYTKVEETRDPEPAELQIAIGGAGLSGVEIAAEMADVIEKHHKTLGTNAKKIRITLIDAADTILPGMSSYIVNRTAKRLESLGIRILTNAFIDRVEDGAIHLKDGTALSYRFMIFTGGIIANTLQSDVPLETNRLGQIVPDAYLRLSPHMNVYAVGDCVELKDAKGNLLPPTAQTAEKSAEYVAASIRKRLNGDPVSPFHAKVDGVFVALGGRYAVGELFGIIRVSGYTAYLLKKLITKGYYLGLKLRINTGFKKRTEA
ncbi:NAD(P)/FAD-dependent oxidoreductase [Sulfurimonas diazotrophicus]|uniref:NAD(P)/FAD-dependent oxidoreductase n=1 Tax=Sulfurimonas diazotrophicus TaxID=3131939 RepID=A0ABZ3H9W0_9BACT